MVLCFVQIDKLYNCVYILSYQFILIKRTSHKPLHELVFYFLSLLHLLINGRNLVFIDKVCSVSSLTLLLSATKSVSSVWFQFRKGYNEQNGQT